MKQVHLPSYIFGRARDIAVNAIASRSGIHETTLSRFFNAKQNLNPVQLVEIGIAIGELRVIQATQDRTTQTT
jgi:hypothetical protein